MQQELVYLQILFILVDIRESEDMWMVDKLHYGDFSFHLDRGRKGKMNNKVR